MALHIVFISSACIAASDSRSSFQSIHTVDELLALPTSKLCVDGGPSSDDIRLMLLNGPLTLPMYQNDPAMARMMINEQSSSIKSRIREKCSSKPNVSSRKLTKETLRNESEMCQQGAPTKDEIKAYIKESKDPNIDIDKQLRAIPYEYRLMMEEGAKLKGLTLREAFVEDIASVSAKKWKDACSKHISSSKTTHKMITDSVSSMRKIFNEADTKLNMMWGNLPYQKRKALLPSQRQWIKEKTSCNKNMKCLIDMTNERITILEAER